LVLDCHPQSIAASCILHSGTVEVMGLHGQMKENPQFSSSISPTPTLTTLAKPTRNHPRPVGPLARPSPSHPPPAASLERTPSGPLELKAETACAAGTIGRYPNGTLPGLDAKRQFGCHASRYGPWRSTPTVYLHARLVVVVVRSRSSGEDCATIWAGGGIAEFLCSVASITTEAVSPPRLLGRLG
jgi:hypothetical protein